ncbi:MAG: Mut7-C RNAse domain-containing protein [Nitrososphaeraceae archaeon]
MSTDQNIDLKNNLKHFSIRITSYRNNKFKFIADEMLGKIARKLRIYGFDTAYIKDVLDDEILKLGINENRIILTKDKIFFQKILRKNAKSIFLKNDLEIENLVEIFLACKIYNISFSLLNSRCSICNGILLKSKKQTKLNHNFTFNRKRSDMTLFECTNCHKIYWNGSHIKNIEKYILRINKILDQHKPNKLIFSH